MIKRKKVLEAARDAEIKARVAYEASELAVNSANEIARGALQALENFKN